MPCCACDTQTCAGLSLLNWSVHVVFAADLGVTSVLDPSVIFSSHKCLIFIPVNIVPCVLKNLEETSASDLALYGVEIYLLMMSSEHEAI